MHYFKRAFQIAFVSDVTEKEDINQAEGLAKARYDRLLARKEHQKLWKHYRLTEEIIMNQMAACECLFHLHHLHHFLHLASLHFYIKL